MALGDVRALPLIVASPTTTRATVLTVPSGKEWIICLIRATNVSTVETSITVSSGTNGDAQIAFNEVLPLPTASLNGSKDLLGLQKVPLQAGTVLQARAGSDNTVRLTIGGFERDMV